MALWSTGASVAQEASLKDAFGTPLNSTANSIGYNTSQNQIDPIISNAIQVFLSLLGVIFLALIIYGGFTWMTAAGNESKVTKAKELITAALIGFVLVVSAYAITFFVISKLAARTINVQ